MSVLKFENRTPRSLDEMYEYMRDPEKTGGEGMLGIGVNPCAPVQEMQFIQDIYDREDLAHPYVQVILSFDAGISLELPELQEMCMEIGQVLIADERQVFGAIHTLGTDNLHCHYMINYVGMDGALYRQEHHVNYYKRKVNEILKSHGLKPVKVLVSPPFYIRGY